VSENHVSIVDIDVTSAHAQEVGERVRSWLVENAIVLQSDSPAQSPKVRFAPGPRFWAVFDSPDTDVINGHVELEIGRRVYDTGGNGVELACPRCESHFEPEDDWFELIGPWFEGDDTIAYSCVKCGFEQRLSEWDGPFVMGFGHVGLTLNDSPPPSPVFVAQLGQFLGHRLRVVYQHI